MAWLAWLSNSASEASSVQPISRLCTKSAETDHALGRSRGGLTTKIHMLCDANGVPLHFLLSGGQASDIA
jgi:hypothetical protein